MKNYWLKKEDKLHFIFHDVLTKTLRAEVSSREEYFIAQRNDCFGITAYWAFRNYVITLVDSFIDAINFANRLHNPKWQDLPGKDLEFEMSHNGLWSTLICQGKSDSYEIMYYNHTYVGGDEYVVRYAKKYHQDCKDLYEVLEFINDRENGSL